MDLGALAFDEAGLVTVVVQDRLSGEVRMVAHADREALRRTLETGQAWFWSRSRKALWKKGETSGNVLHVREVIADCDRDAVVYLVDPEGPTCHTGNASCFFEPKPAEPLLLRLEHALAARAAASPSQSYTRTLLDGGAPAIGAKIREEADEFARALHSESDERIASEAADLVYHAMVGLQLRRVPLRAVLAELARRFGRSGHDEKAARAVGN